MLGLHYFEVTEKCILSPIVYPGLGADEKLKLTTKLALEASFSDLFKNSIIKIFETKINFLKVSRWTNKTGTKMTISHKFKI
jgi:hypothetical protein